MSGYMTHIDYTDAYAKVPGSDDAIGAWRPLSDGQRMGAECIDCGAGFGGHEVGTCEDGPVYVCASCYQQRLFDHNVIPVRVRFRARWICVRCDRIFREPPPRHVQMDAATFAYLLNEEE